MKILNFLKRKPAATKPRATMSRQKQIVPKPTPAFGNPNRTILMFWPDSVTHGWAELTIRRQPNRDGYEDSFADGYEDHYWESRVSYIEDTFSQLLDAFIALAEGKLEASAFAEMEPYRAEFRFSHKPETAGVISLTILEWSPYREGVPMVNDDAQHWTKIETTCRITLKHLMDDVLWIGNELEQRFGADSYWSAWGFPLPIEKLKKLKQLRDAQE